MKDGENIVRRLAECGQIMASGQFTAYDLDYIKQALENMLKATISVIAKKNKVLKPDACGHSPNICKSKDVNPCGNVCNFSERAT